MTGVQTCALPISALRDALASDEQVQLEGAEPGHQMHRSWDPVHPEIYDDPNGVESLNGNTVDRAAEMAKMAENQILYDASTEMLKKKLAMLRYSVTEGGGNR